MAAHTRAMRPSPTDIPMLLADVPAHAWALVAGVVLAQRLLRHAGLWAYAVFALPGTAAHELAHWLLAWLTGAKPGAPRLWPVREGRTWRLGSVAFRPAWWRTAPIALAPLLLLPLALAWTVHFVGGAAGAAMLLHAWVAGTLAGASLPSRADLRLAAPGLATVALLGLLATLAWQVARG